MKKFKSIILFLTIILTSCTEPSLMFNETFNENQEEVPILCVKRTVDYSDYFTVNTKTYDYNYEGNKLMDWKLTSVYDNEIKTTTYTNLYSDNLISRMIVDRGDSSDYFEFKRDSIDRVIEQVKNDTLEYTWSYDKYKVMKFNKNGDLIEEQTYTEDFNLVETRVKLRSDSEWVQVNRFSHDDKNMPFMNVHNWYPLSPFKYISPNNIVYIKTNMQHTETAQDSNSHETIIEISYNIDRFPGSIHTQYAHGGWKSEVLEYNK